MKDLLNKFYIQAGIAGLIALIVILVNMFTGVPSDMMCAAFCSAPALLCWISIYKNEDAKNQWFNAIIWTLNVILWLL